MPKLVKPSTKNSPKVVVGKNSNNKPAEAYDKQGTNYKLAEEAGKNVINEMNPSAGTVSKGNYKPVKTDGIKIRGTGAAERGVMARGPMA
jgi:hypothetical protein